MQFLCKICYLGSLMYAVCEQALPELPLLGLLLVLYSVFLQLFRGCEMVGISERSFAAHRSLTSFVLEGFHLLLGIRSELLVPAWSMFLHAALGLALQVLLFLGLYFLHSREGGEAVSDGSFKDHTVQQARRRRDLYHCRPTRPSRLTLGSPECCGHIKCPGHDGMNDVGFSSCSTSTDNTTHAVSSVRVAYST